MLATLAQINEVLDVEPEIDPAVFWPRVGVALDAIVEYGRIVARANGVPFSAVMAGLESGAALAEHTMKGGA